METCRDLIDKNKTRLLPVIEQALLMSHDLPDVVDYETLNQSQSNQEENSPQSNFINPNHVMLRAKFLGIETPKSMTPKAYMHFGVALLHSAVFVTPKLVSLWVKDDRETNARNFPFTQLFYEKPFLHKDADTEHGW